MDIGTLIVLILLGGLLAWKLGSVVLRAVGGLLFLVGLLGATEVTGGLAIGVFVALLGVLLWLTGHWLFAFRHHVYRSPLAQQVFLRALPHWLDPTRNWGVRAIDNETR